MCSSVFVLPSGKTTMGFLRGGVLFQIVKGVKSIKSHMCLCKSTILCCSINLVYDRPRQMRSYCESDKNICQNI